jgi:putative selenate reductase
MMRPVSFPRLVEWIRGGDRVFGLGKGQFYRPAAVFPFLGSGLGTLVGPAAGPHTQLAQNIAASYLAGGRFIELKTVQTLDGEELAGRIPRPCISARDEGYNVEWSTELTVEGALAEYVKAWFLLHVLAEEFELFPPDAPGIPGAPDFIFSMSVGYSLEGIRSEKIDRFIEGLKDASGTAVWESCYRYLAEHLGDFTRFGRAALDRISPAVSPAVTLSTLHGCPREEIEGIARYLLEEKKLHTFVKCNPTLLGYERVRAVLDRLGYGYVSFDDRHFREDIQLDQALEMLGRLREAAALRGLVFGVKLTNTLPVDCRAALLEGQEMYMSGRALFPLSIAAAALLGRSFGGPISYSGGADFFNLDSILKTGLGPLTVATTLLKPGGYGRLRQLAEIAGRPPVPLDPAALEALAERAGDPDAAEPWSRYRKSYRARWFPGAKEAEDAPPSSPLPLWDCALAPCSGEGGCPAGQDVPGYLEAAAAGDFYAAMGIIARDNSAPSITGAICDQRCRRRCVRLDYEDPLGIRELKALIASKAQAAFTGALEKTALAGAGNAAVVGAGPAGVAAALFLRRNGVPVTVFEKREQAYGMVRYVIPEFRISPDLIDRDYELALKTGVEFRFGHELGGPGLSLDALRREYRYVVLALGAWARGPSPLAEGECLDALEFLERGKALTLGKRAAVIGGGDTAMDCARAVLRQGSEVTLIYRRSREDMGAQAGELELALGEGAELLELHAPLSYRRGILRCEITRMEGAAVPGLRRGFSGTGRFTELPFDTVISAAGARVDGGFLEKLGIALDGRGLPRLNAAGETSLPGVYIAGDGGTGPATVIAAIAGAKAAAADILEKLGLAADFSRPPGRSRPADCSRPPAPPLSAEALEALLQKRGTLLTGGREEAGQEEAGREGRREAARCLSCGRVCEICCEVCPNRANLAVTVPEGPEGPARRQVIHLDALCNECGNCAVFCPRRGIPYREKFTLFSGEGDFAGSANPGFLPLGRDRFRLRLEGRVFEYGGPQDRPDPALDRAALDRAALDRALEIVTQVIGGKRDSDS